MRFQKLAFCREKDIDSPYGRCARIVRMGVLRKNIIIFGDYLRNGDTKSCGCIVSWHESQIAKMLENLNFTFSQQYYCNDLIMKDTGYYLYYDFAIFNQNKLLYLIEYDGKQHFDKDAAHWGHNEADFNRNREKDLLKNKYCFDNNILNRV